MSDSFMLYFHGQQFGPHTRDEIVAMLSGGSIDASASVYNEAWPDWRPVSMLVRPIAVAGSESSHGTAFSHGSDAGEAADQLGGYEQQPLAVGFTPRSNAKKGKATKRSRCNLYIGLSIGGGALLVALIIAAVMLSGPGISIQPRSAGNYFYYWSITNDAHSGLTIERVVLNGEHVARLATVSGNQAQQSESTQPVTLGSGDSQAYFEHSDLGAGPEYYVKKVTFIDLYTSRGNYRYYIDSGFSSEQPSFDEAKAKASDEEMAVESRKLDEKRRGVIHNMFQ